MRMFLAFMVGAMAASCASLFAVVIPTLGDRTLRISADKSGLEYRYEICTSRFLGICTEHKYSSDFYDLTNAETRKQLINMEFVCRTSMPGRNPK